MEARVLFSMLRDAVGFVREKVGNFMARGGGEEARLMGPVHF